MCQIVSSCSDVRKTAEGLVSKFTSSQYEVLSGEHSGNRLLKDVSVLCLVCMFSPGHYGFPQDSLVSFRSPKTCITG